MIACTKKKREKHLQRVEMNIQEFDFQPCGKKEMPRFPLTDN